MLSLLCVFLKVLVHHDLLILSGGNSLVTGDKGYLAESTILSITLSENCSLVADNSKGDKVSRCLDVMMLYSFYLRLGLSNVHCE